MTRLSVRLPVYNAAPYLTESLNSLLAQTRPADQIVIVNDGSTDHSLDLLQQFMRREPRIQIIDQKNQGVSVARNRGLALCEGDFVALMDADDICHPNRFSVQLETMQRKRLDLCGSWMRTFGNKNRELRYPCGDAELKWNILYLGRTLPNPTVMMRRQAVGITRYREDLHFAEDFGFFLELLMKNPQIRMGNIPKTLLHYRTHTGQASKNLKDQNQRNIITLFNDQLPSANIDATLSQLAEHFTVWQNKTPLTALQLKSYLPFMQVVSGWLLQHTGDRRLSAQHWKALAKIHSSQGEESFQLILDAAGSDQPLSWRLMEKLRSFLD